jgi:hypothetical protein
VTVTNTQRTCQHTRLGQGDIAGKRRQASKIAIHSDVKMGITIYGLQFRTIIFTELTKCNGKERITGFSSGIKNSE